MLSKRGTAQMNATAASPLYAAMFRTVENLVSPFPTRAVAKFGPDSCLCCSGATRIPTALSTLDWRRMYGRPRDFTATCGEHWADLAIPHNHRRAACTTGS